MALSFDFNNMTSRNVGSADGVTDEEFAEARAAAARAGERLSRLFADPAARVALNLEWAALPFQDPAGVGAAAELGDRIAASYENVLFLGIGGSYLGLKAAQDALRPPYWNEFPALRGGRPRVYFDGNNLDPEPLAVLLGALDPERTFVVVISKSGETTETRCAFSVVSAWLRKGVGETWGRQVCAVTDPSSGALRTMVEAERARDPLSFPSFPLMRGVGGRYSEMNMGLLHLAIVGVPAGEVLAGAAEMFRRCSAAEPEKNPAALYAALHVRLCSAKGKDIAIVMPFAEGLKSTADWYVQLLAESLGKKFGRRISAGPGGEAWEQDPDRIVHAGRTPVPARGTNDLHSIHQNNVEGMNNKTVTFIRVERFERDIVVPGGDFLGGRRYAALLNLAEEATEWSLAAAGRPSCTVSMPELTPSAWGELLMFFEMATAFEGELLDVNAYDQPGVEGYKRYMYVKLGKPGVPESVRREIEAAGMEKDPRFVLRHPAVSP